MGVGGSARQRETDSSKQSYFLKLGIFMKEKQLPSPFNCVLEET